MPINLKAGKLPGLLTVVFWLQSITFISQREKKMIPLLSSYLEKQTAF